MIDAESLEGMKVLIRQKDEQIRVLTNKATITEQTLRSLVEAQKALADGKTDDAAAIIMRTINALRKET